MFGYVVVVVVLVVPKQFLFSPIPIHVSSSFLPFTLQIES